MDNGVRISAAAMINRARQQEYIAQNTANINTDYYKSEDVYFSLDNRGEQQVVTQTDFSSGPMRATGNNLDIVMGNNFFLKAEDNSGAVSYVKNGKLSVDSQGQLNFKGFKILDTEGKPVIVNTPSDLEIRPNGDVFQAGLKTNTLDIVETTKDAKINPGTSNTYFLSSDGVMQPSGFMFLKQGYAEGSNVSNAKEILNMINVSHAYEASQKSLLSNDDVVNSTISQLGKF
jgi:flagellar basal body rod protein FlgG